MLFLVLGTQKFQLNRLLAMVDAYIADGSINTEVVAQIGHSDYEPKHFKFFRFLDKAQFEAYMEAADIVITHSGVGSIISAIHKKKVVIVFPRIAKYKEHVDDHQTEIARAFAKKGYVLCCGENDNLLELIETSKSYSFQPYISQTDNIVNIINTYISNPS